MIKRTHIGKISLKVGTCLLALALLGVLTPTTNAFYAVFSASALSKVASPEVVSPEVASPTVASPELASPEVAPLATKAAFSKDLSLTAQTALPADVLFSDAASPLSREEVIYGSLSATGTVEALYAVITLTTGGKGTVRDYGVFSAVSNLTDVNLIERSSNGIAVATNSESFTYQGNLITTQLPWDIRLSYTLDGRSITPEALAGSSGKLGFTVEVNHTQNADITFTDHYMLQITVTLNPQNVTNIISDTASIVLAGGERVLNFTILPGKDSINSFTADIVDFELKPIEIIAIPFSMAFDMPDTSEITDGFQKLLDAIALLDTGATELKSGASFLANSSATVANGSAAINEALQLIASGLSQSTSFDISQLEQLPDVLKQLASGLEQVTASIALLAPGYHNALAGLEIALSHIPDGNPALDAAVYAHYLANTGDAAVAAMYMSYLAGTSLKAAYFDPESGMQLAFVAADSALAELPASLATISYALRVAADLLPDAQTIAAFSGQLATLQTSLDSLAQTYGSFHAGITSLTYGLAVYSSNMNSFADGLSTMHSETADMPERVLEQINAFMADYQATDFIPVSFVSAENENTQSAQFVLRTTAIEKPKSPVPPAILEEEPTFLERLLALFGF